MILHEGRAVVLQGIPGADLPKSDRLRRANRQLPGLIYDAEMGIYWLRGRLKAALWILVFLVAAGRGSIWTARLSRASNWLVLSEK